SYISGIQAGVRSDEMLFVLYPPCAHLKPMRCLYRHRYRGFRVVLGQMRCVVRALSTLCPFKTDEVALVVSI
ncbi:hypothetical protein AVEN_24328-1, partial [Araneus ventricosus]